MSTDADRSRVNKSGQVDLLPTAQNLNSPILRSRSRGFDLGALWLGYRPGPVTILTHSALSAARLENKPQGLSQRDSHRGVLSFPTCSQTAKYGIGLQRFFVGAVNTLKDAIPIVATGEPPGRATHLETKRF